MPPEDINPAPPVNPQPVVSPQPAPQPMPVIPPVPKKSFAKVLIWVCVPDMFMLVWRRGLAV